MRKYLVLVLPVLMAFCMEANASTSVGQLTEPDYVINNGYSEATAEEITYVKSRAAGKPSEPIYEKKRNRFIRFCRNVYGYIDPASDTDERIHHDIHMSPNFKDL